MQGIGYGGRLERGGSSMLHSTVSFGSLYGPAAGEAVSARASVAPSGMHASIPGAGMLSLPLVLAMGFLVWYALKTYD